MSWSSLRNQCAQRHAEAHLAARVRMSAASRLDMARLRMCLPAPPTSLREPGMVATNSSRRWSSRGTRLSRETSHARPVHLGQDVVRQIGLHVDVLESGHGVQAAARGQWLLEPARSGHGSRLADVSDILGETERRRQSDRWTGWLGLVKIDPGF